MDKLWIWRSSFFQIGVATCYVFGTESGASIGRMVYGTTVTQHA